jgi:hypothetical protein
MEAGVKETFASTGAAASILLSFLSSSPAVIDGKSVGRTKVLGLDKWRNKGQSGAKGICFR